MDLKNGKKQKWTDRAFEPRIRTVYWMDRTADGIVDHKLDGALVNKLDRGPKRRQDSGSNFGPGYGPKKSFEGPVVIKFEKP